MILIAVKRFKDSLELCTKEEILALKQLSGYGIACSGDGSYGVYKLEVRFGQYTVFVTKIELGARERLTAAALMDHCQFSGGGGGGGETCVLHHL